MMGRGMMRGGMGSMMARMIGVLGDDILVNGRPSASLSVERRPYRLRVLNASNTRIYKLAWDDGSPLIVIGTDGGLLAAPAGIRRRLCAVTTSCSPPPSASILESTSHDGREAANCRCKALASTAQ